MRRTLLISAGLFLMGLALGVLATSHVWIVESRLLRESALAEYQNEQLIRASRAHRSGDAFRYVLHSMNAADAQAEVGFRRLQWFRAQTYWGWFRSPWLSFPLIWDIDPYMDSSAEFDKGRRILEAQYRAQAALALEQFDRPDLAREQWKLATGLMPGWTLEEHREFAAGHPWSCGEDYEAAYLDSETFEEFSIALERIRTSYLERTRISRQTAE